MKDAEGSPEEVKAILEERARRLAVPIAKPAGDTLEIVTFALGGERYAVALREVFEVTRAAEPTPLPGGPEVLAGFVALRGEIVPVVDLKRLLGIAEGGAAEAPRIIFFGDEHAELAVIADAVGDVARLRADDLLEAPASVVGAGRAYIRGVTRDAVIVLSGAALLGDEQIISGGDAGYAMTPRGDEVGNVDR